MAFPPPPGADPEVLVAASSAATGEMLIAFAFAVARTHPNPEALAEAFDRNLTESSEAVKSLPGRDRSEFKWASAMAHDVAVSLMKAILRR